MSNTITKRELVGKICAELDSAFTQEEVLQIVQKVVDEITAALSKGNKVVIRNFGTFIVKEVKPKVGRNPKNPAKDVPIPARSVVKFKVGKTLKEAAAKVSL
ncbi:MAG: integration host factor subunit beta [Akkermansia sp.]|nr:integration host factor subunit beta [Akkermansia sp.]